MKAEPQIQRCRKVAKLRYERLLGMRRNWCETDADQWTREDIVAAGLSFISYFLIAAGLPLLLLNQISGYILFFAGILSAALMYLIIDPKLRAISASYEERQRQYLKEVEEKQRWKE